MGIRFRIRSGLFFNATLAQIVTIVTGCIWVVTITVNGSQTVSRITVMVSISIGVSISTSFANEMTIITTMVRITISVSEISCKFNKFIDKELQISVEKKGPLPILCK